MAKIIMMCGAPGSGKSTYATEHKDKNDMYISRDLVRFSLVSEDEDYFSKETMVFNKFIDLINMSLQMENIENIWVDATHLTKKSRTKVIRRILPKYSSIEVVFINVPEQVCLYRNSLREGRAVVPEGQVRRMFESIEEPSLKEGFSKITIVDYNGGETIYE